MTIQTVGLLIGTTIETAIVNWIPAGEAFVVAHQDDRLTVVARRKLSTREILDVLGQYYQHRLERKK